MARPKFSVQHFVACLKAAWEGQPGPRTARTLEGVIHRFGVPPVAEPTFFFDEVWLYARLFRTNQIEGTRAFSVRLLWLDSPGGAIAVWTRRVSNVRFSNAEPVANVAWALRPVEFPGLGLYEFQLRVRRGARIRRRVIAREYIRIEHQP
jgi:hypothetical protein